MPLFTVELLNIIVVEADDATHAHDVARDNKTSACMDSAPLYNVIGEITSSRELPRDWDEKCYPYGGESPMKTIGEILGS